MTRSPSRLQLRALFDDSHPVGRVVGWVIMALIVGSCVSAVVETVPTVSPGLRRWLRGFEYLAVGVFTLEYVLRIASSERPFREFFKPLVLVDLVAIAPFYLGLVAAGVVDLSILRLLRTLRVLRMLKMNRYTRALSMLAFVIRDARHRLLSFLLVVAIIIVLMGSVMYQLEPETFESIPHAIWWSIVTLTTVGYGNVVPESALGRVVASGLMMLGIGIVAIPTSIISTGMVEYYHRHGRAESCAGCGAGDHARDALFCRACGIRFQAPAADSGGRNEDVDT